MAIYEAYDKISLNCSSV